MFREFLKGLINPDSVYQARDVKRSASSFKDDLNQFVSGLGVGEIASNIASKTGFEPTVSRERWRHRNHTVDPVLTFGSGKPDDTEFVTKVTIPVTQRRGRVMEDHYIPTGHIMGGFDGNPGYESMELVGLKPSKKQTLTDTVQIIVREGGGRGSEAEVDVVASKFAPTDRGALHRKVFQEIVKSAQLSVTSASGDKQRILNKITEVLRDIDK
jgi:hypothetical protein